ncbi:MAG: GNAT family N-acetyltransferase [Proteobacteria bacterium]|nr:GNAT family N-acetyltransferase [Pseudomonadota bacterium]
MSGTRALLALQAQTLFELSPQLRMVRARDPDNSPAPRLYLGGGDDGWVGYVRHDIGETQTREINSLLRDEPAVTAPGATPCHAERYRKILDAEPLSPHNYGPVHRLPRGVPAPHVDATIVCCDTAEGRALTERIIRDGMPKGLSDAGFVDLSHFWAPWCAATVGDDIAALAFCVRDGLMAREIGVYTVADYRGRGYAPAVTAAWSRLHPRHPVLFYSTHRDNLASQRVIARLRLPFLGESMRIP